MSCETPPHLIKNESSELQGLSCGGNIVIACCLSAGRTAGVCPAFHSSAHAVQGRRVARDCLAPSTGSHVIQSKPIWLSASYVLLAVFWRVHLCVNMRSIFQTHLWPLAITPRTKICVELVQRPPRTSKDRPIRALRWRCRVYIAQNSLRCTSGYHKTWKCIIFV